MNQYFPALATILAAIIFFGASAAAQDKTAPATAAEKEAAYTVAIEKRTDAVMPDGKPAGEPWHLMSYEFHLKPLSAAVYQDGSPYVSSL